MFHRERFIQMKGDAVRFPPVGSETFRGWEATRRFRQKGGMGKRLLSIPEAAEYIGHAPGTLRNRISRGDLAFRYIRHGRKVLVDQRDLDRWIDQLPRIGGDRR